MAETGAARRARGVPRDPVPEHGPPGAPAAAAGGSPRRLLAIAGAALGLYALAAAAIVWAFGVNAIGYYFFDASDIPLYFRYAHFLAAGGRPYVDFGVEYPPLALSLFALAGPPDHIDAYAHRFALEMLAFGAAAAVATGAAAARAWEAGRRPYLAAAGFALGVAATGALLANRYDAAVSLVLAACLLFLVLGWHWAAALSLGLGFALKLVPAVLLPLVLLLAPSGRSALRAAGAFAAAAAVPFLPHVPKGLAGLSQIFAYHGMRPLQVESVLATPFWLGRLLGLVEVRVSNGFGGQNLVAAGAEATAGASGAIALAVLVLSYAAIWRRRAELRRSARLVPLAAAAVLISFIATGKVLSPQFLVWLLPCLGLLLPSRPALAALLLGAMVLTQIEFPANYFAFVGLEPRAISCVVARNVVLVAALVLSIVQLWRIPAHAPEAPSPQKVR